MYRSHRNRLTAMESTPVDISTLPPTSTDISINATTGSYEASTHLYDTYDVFIHPHWYQFPPVSDEWHYAIGIYITIVGLSGVFGNALVIWIFSTTKRLKTPSNMFVVNLALSDLIFSAVNGFPLLTISAFSKKWIFGKVACQMYGLVGGIFGLMSINTLGAISIDRYYAITKPLKAASTMTRKRSFLMIVSVWIWSMAWAVPPIFGWGAYIPEGFQTSCTFDYLTNTPFMRSYIFCLYICGFAMPLLVIFFCYVLIVKSIHKHEQEMLKMARKMKVDDIKANQEKQKTEIKLAKIAMLIITLFILSWSPYATVALIGQFGPAEWVTPFVSELPVMLAKASAMHNPIVYALNHPKFREELYSRLPWIFCCCDPPPSTSSSMQSRSDRKNLSRTASGGSTSDVSSCFSNLSDSAYGPSIDVRKSIPTTRETSLSRKISEIRPDNESLEEGGYSKDLVRELVHALVDVAHSQNRPGPVIQPVYLPMMSSSTSNGEEAQGSKSQDVYVVNKGKQMDLSTYLGQIMTNADIKSVPSTSQESPDSPSSTQEESNPTKPKTAQENIKDEKSPQKVKEPVKF